LEYALQLLAFAMNNGYFVPEDSYRLIQGQESNQPLPSYIFSVTAKHGKQCYRETEKFLLASPVKMTGLHGHSP